MSEVQADRTISKDSEDGATSNGKRNRDQDTTSELSINNGNTPGNANDKIISVTIPEMNILYKVELESDIDMNRINQGRANHLQYGYIMTKFLTQPMYALIIEKRFTFQNFNDVMTSHYSDAPKYEGNTYKKFLLMQERYQLNEDNLITDNRNNKKLIVPPDQLYDLIMYSHFLNNHLPPTKVHSNLKKRFANVTRALVRFSLRNCSRCNPDDKFRVIENAHKHTFDKNYAFEKIHIEIFKPYDDLDKFAKKYSHVLYIRDYYTRYIWIYPLKKISLNEISTNLATHLLTSIRIPLFIESLTIEKDNLLQILKNVSESTQLTIGIGTKNPNEFHACGINNMKLLFEKYRKFCVNDWNSCLLYCQNTHNRTYNTKVFGCPFNLIAQETYKDAKTYRKKRQRTTMLTLSKNIVLLNDKKSAIFYESHENSINMEIDNSYEAVGSEYDETQISTSYEFPYNDNPNKRHKGINQ